MSAPEKGRIRGRGILDGCPATVVRQTETRVVVSLGEDRGPWKKGDAIPIDPADWVKHDPADVFAALQEYEREQARKNKDKDGTCTACLGKRVDPFGADCPRCLGAGIEPPKREPSALENLANAALAWLKKD